MPRKSLSAATVVSVGYEGRNLADIVVGLTRNRVQILVDVRLTPISRKKGFSKGALAAALEQAGIEYLHAPGLGNPRDNREAFRKGLKSARRRYERHLANGASATYEATIELARTSRVALLCFEREHSQCHRSSILDRAVLDHPGISVLKL